MALKLRIPQPGEERLTLQKGVKFRICTEDGYQEGVADLQWAIPPDDTPETLTDRENRTTLQDFIRERLRKVIGLKDEAGEEWPQQEAIEFFARSPDTQMTAFRAYLKHVTSEEHVRADLKNSLAPSTPSQARRH